MRDFDNGPQTDQKFRSLSYRLARWLQSTVLSLLVCIHYEGVYAYELVVYADTMDILSTRVPPYPH